MLYPLDHETLKAGAELWPPWHSHRYHTKDVWRVWVEWITSCPVALPGLVIMFFKLLKIVGTTSELMHACLVTQSCPTLCDPLDCSLPGSSVHGILQAIILEWIVISFSRGFSWPRDRTWVSCIAGRFFTVWATGKAILNSWETKLFKPGLHI